LLKRLEFGPWEPDKAATSTLRDARNLMPGKDGYYPVSGLSAVTSAMPGNFIGGGAFVGFDGTAALLAGTSTNLYRYSGTTWSSVYTGSASHWRFAQFGTLVIAATGGAPVKFDLAGGAAALLGGTPPAASLVATVRDFVVLAGDPAAIQTVTWSGFNDAEGWTGGTNQSGDQILPDGGEIMGLAGGEYGLILQRRAIKRLSYVGTPLVFQIDEISSNVGCMAKGSVAQAGRLVFFLSERGFFYTDGNDTIPIGDEKFNRWFFGRFSRSDIENGLTAAVDPRANVVYWTMPGSPGVVLVYHITLQRASYLQLSVKAVFDGFTANVSLEALDALYPSGIDSIPVSLDDPTFSGGSPLILFSTNGNVIATLSGNNLEARIETASSELAPGKRVRLRSFRPVTDAENGAIVVDIRPTDAGDPATFAASAMRPNGEYPVRANGRHSSTAFTIPAATNWTYVSGLDVTFEVEGGR